MVDRMQMGLPEHVVDTILSKPARWQKTGDLLKKQLGKLLTRPEVDNVLYGLAANCCYFPVTATYYYTEIEPVLHASRYHGGIVYKTDYCMVVLLRFLAV